MLPDRRTAGLLLHPTSLPGAYGIGDLGPAGDAFLDWAAAAGIGLWQVLPLGPPGAGDSPYHALSAHAGNPLLISPERLADEGLLTAEELAGAPSATPGQVDFATVAAWKTAVLRAAWRRWSAAGATGRKALDAFAAASPWLDDWALYAALRQDQAGKPWHRWEESLRRRRGRALTRARRELGDEIDHQRWLQLVFDRQWQRLRRRAGERGIAILGDLPIYVAYDSAEVWARPELFDLDDDLAPRAVAGVPPDAFSASGQLWGNPLYAWQRHAAEGYAWWRGRLRSAQRHADAVRLDHFRGFEAFWRVPAGAGDAAGGEWVPGPGRALFDALDDDPACPSRQEVGEQGRREGLPLVAEDLGHITPEVEALRLALGLPGMRVLQFAFGEHDSSHLPHHHPRNAVVYTATHDNDTARAWFAGLGGNERRRAAEYLGLSGSGEGIEWALIRAAYTSVARWAVVPVQDALGLGGEARMNLPGQADGNWRWRLRDGELTPPLAARLRRLAEISGRLADNASADAVG